ncbi:hypothetical protein [Celerinatantimonas yamalensis]|uniref:TIGR03503 family protein n=1 Tax=Celerinatantimonas yamalensis TaxID=559956 RepID=A0ABW9GCQ1_9GAMM
MLHRKTGSASAILVRPDGSKIYPWRLPSHIHWLETPNVDIVTIENPMPGPWQALVETDDPRNIVQVVSDIKLEVDPFPIQVFVGEKLSLKARLLSHGKPLVFGPYMDGVLFHVHLDSADSPDANDTAYAHKTITALRDDGSQFDGYPQDGTYTGYITLNIPAGKYDLDVSTQNNVFTRGYRQVLLVSHQPYETELISPTDKQPLKLKVIADADEVKVNSIVIDGTMSNGSGFKQHFEVRTRKAPSDFTFDLPTPSKPGSYRINAIGYADTTGGRPVVMTMPEKSFYIAPPPPPVVDVEPKVISPPPKSYLLDWIIGGGVAFILFLGGGLFWIWQRKRKAFKKALMLAEAKADEVIELESQPPMAGAETNINSEGPATPGLDSEPDLTIEDDNKE